MCSTRGAFFEPMSKRQARAKFEQREARPAPAARGERRKADERRLAQKVELGEKSMSTGARLAFRDDSDMPDKLRGKRWNW